MGKVGGNRNFGYGKKMAWAGGQALRDRSSDSSRTSNPVIPISSLQHSL